MHAPRVAPVDRDAADAIQASILIPSLSVAVEELVRNAAEAGANVVTVRVHARDGFISVQDDGTRLASRSYTGHGAGGGG